MRHFAQIILTSPSKYATIKVYNVPFPSLRGSFLFTLRGVLKDRSPIFLKRVNMTHFGEIARRVISGELSISEAAITLGCDVELLEVALRTPLLYCEVGEEECLKQML